jgi:hypothetical protein
MRALSDIYIGSGVSRTTGKAFCHITASEHDGDADSELHGQLTPAEVRSLASDWMLAAAAAEYDALVVGLLIEEVGISREAALSFLFKLRERRAAIEASESSSEVE